MTFWGTLVVNEFKKCQINVFGGKKAVWGQLSTVPSVHVPVRIFCKGGYNNNNNNNNEPHGLTRSDGKSLARWANSGPLANRETLVMGRHGDLSTGPTRTLS